MACAHGFTKAKVLRTKLGLCPRQSATEPGLIPESEHESNAHLKQTRNFANSASVGGTHTHTHTCSLWEQPPSLGRIRNLAGNAREIGQNQPAAAIAKISGNLQVKPNARMSSAEVPTNQTNTRRQGSDEAAFPVATKAQ